MDYLIKEIQFYKELGGQYLVDSIFIGGGTPSSIDGELIERIMEAIYSNFKVAHDSENTIEVNPGSLDPHKLRSYKRAGINRISMGVQTLNDDILKDIGRIHDSKTFFDNYRQVREEGFENVSLDLMFNLPEQSEDFLRDTIDRIIKLEPEHISLYSLILEEGTVLSKRYEEGSFILADEDNERRMYHDSISLFKEYGYNQYEVSNFSKEARESRHNIKYWTLRPYLGFGLGSHSNIARERFSNARWFDSYYELIDRGKKPVVNREIIGDQERMFEFLMMGLRLKKGVNLEEFSKRYGMELLDFYGQAIDKNIAGKLLKLEDGYLSFTDLGMDLSNQVYLDFMD